MNEQARLKEEQEDELNRLEEELFLETEALESLGKTAKTNSEKMYKLEQMSFSTENRLRTEVQSLQKQQTGLKSRLDNAHGEHTVSCEQTSSKKQDLERDIGRLGRSAVAMEEELLTKEEVLHSLKIALNQSVETAD